MVDEDTEKVAAEPAGAPANRDAQRDPGVIEGEVLGRGADQEGPPPSATEPAAGPSPVPTAKPARTGVRGFAAGALAGLIVSALTTGAGFYFLASKGDLAEHAGRVAALETQAQHKNAAQDAEAERQSAQVASLDKRVSALEANASASSGAEVDKRLAALEQANAENAPNMAAAKEVAQRLTTLVADLRTDVDAARGEISGLSARTAKLEAAPQNGEGPDLSALAARLDKIEAALAAPKAETRAAPEQQSPVDNAAAIAVVAGAIADNLRAGAPFGPELAELERLGVAPEALAPLRVEADGAPTGGALAASFDAVAPKVLAAASQGEQGGVVDRFLAHIHNLVRVRDLNETAGDDPQALVSQIEASSRRSDVAGALAAFDKLPEAGRQAAGDWATQARARQAAEAALQSIREAAIGRLAVTPKP
jgi:hypothetical protein